MQYNNSVETKRDVVQILDMYRGLTYSSENYGEKKQEENHFILKCFQPNFSLFQLVFNDGSSDNLFNVNGTIPINYKSKYKFDKF